jgi:hypothetical protein
MYKGIVVDKALIGQDPHFQEGCGSCHGGNERGKTKEEAHGNMVKRPSVNPEKCAGCHGDIAKSYRTSLHFTAAGLKNGVSPRFSEAEKKTFNEKVFEKSCRSCHASCGDCHVRGPAIGGISIGFLKGHRFVKKDDGKTCAFCHGGRVYPEFTGEYGGRADVHYQKGMTCLDCHTKTGLHGDGNMYQTRKEVKDRPSCTKCHKAGQEATDKARKAHATHREKLSCAACHSSAPYRNCYECHLGKGATSRPSFILGMSPRDPKVITTLRVIPVVRDTFVAEGIKMEHFDALPNYWDATPHNIAKRTERTRSCEVCHKEKKDFLTKERLIKEGAKANERLLYIPKPTTK